MGLMALPLAPASCLCRCLWQHGTAIIRLAPCRVTGNVKTGFVRKENWKMVTVQLGEESLLEMVF